MFMTYAMRRWQEICSLIGILNRRVELRQLICWARRKRLSGPRRAYENRLIDEELRLGRYVLVYPRFTLTLRWLHWIGRRALPRLRRRPRSGAAARYRAYNLTLVQNPAYSKIH